MIWFCFQLKAEKCVYMEYWEIEAKRFHEKEKYLIIVSHWVTTDYRAGILLNVLDKRELAGPNISSYWQLIVLNYAMFTDGS